jgi:putative transposase
LLAGVNPLVPRLKKIWADGAYIGQELARWCEERGGWELEIVERSRVDTEGFADVGPIDGLWSGRSDG